FTGRGWAVSRLTKPANRKGRGLLGPGFFGWAPLKNARKHPNCANSGVWTFGVTVRTIVAPTCLARPDPAPRPQNEVAYDALRHRGVVSYGTNRRNHFSRAGREHHQSAQQGSRGCQAPRGRAHGRV